MTPTVATWCRPHSTTPLVAAMDELERRDDVGAVVVTGAGRAFCAGADLDDLAACRDEATLRGIYSGFLRLADSPLPTVAAVNGAAVGAGLNMALACDVIVAGESARFDTRFLQIGLHPVGATPGGSGASPTCSRRWRWWCSARSSTAGGRRRSDWRGPACPTASCSPRPAPSPAGPPPGRPSSCGRMKATIQATDGVTTSEEAVALEVGPQLWSLGAAGVRRAAGVAARADEGGSLSGDPGWEVAAELGGAALAAFADAVGRGTDSSPSWLGCRRSTSCGSGRSLPGGSPRGSITAGGSGRLMAAADGWLAVGLPRLDDLDLLPAWLGIDDIDAADDRVPWDAVSGRLAERPAEDAAAAAQELGLAVSVVADHRRQRGETTSSSRGARSTRRSAIGGRSG